ncbi:UDP-glucose/GDP-mannose dehydrogenase family protein [Priestia aryabhattai]|uniref:UDP-glucose dehydrogenase family protein n=1 Tax=Priestia aryabhattai TaxID=412384 RepID=UPI0004AF59C5|nr:UDP-glucose/GDP-mannose dehydrogenase family protein [Priestia aryabhattai]MED3920226.1 UDP-glucose/GDP-mannose dehydrogenase family protein [Priestia aryabhattai]NGY90112.1 UDP-glucose/GDP-mannose dehydrogenase family protein [Priestia megaterium]
MKISVVGTGYVGLVTGVCLAEIGHDVVCIDTDVQKIHKMRRGQSPIYEPGLDDLMTKNIQEGRLHFTNIHKEGFKDSEIIFIAVGTPQLPDGSANLNFIENVAQDISTYVANDAIVVTKSTVPVGTNYHIQKIIQRNIADDIKIRIASNPEFLREGSAVQDTFNGDRIVIGTDDVETADILEKMYAPLNIPVFKTDISSSEMIKYASNAFLATKISFINEISNICEKLGANVEDVANGMGYDKRIGRNFLNAGIGYGGSCFPKDTQALVQIAGGVEHDFKLLKSVIEVNNSQQKSLIEKIKHRVQNVKNIKIAALGLAFKPNTDDMREAASIPILSSLAEEGALITAYDPIAIENAMDILPSNIQYSNSIKKTLEGADIALIVTEWDEVKSIDLNVFKNLMNTPIVFDGRNCFDLDLIEESDIEYYSMGRKTINPYKYTHIQQPTF